MPELTADLVAALNGELPADQCVCKTISRISCLSPTHGDIWAVHCVEYGEFFFSEIRARSRKDAMELGIEVATNYGGQCFRVEKLKNSQVAC